MCELRHGVVCCLLLYSIVLFVSVYKFVKVYYLLCCDWSYRNIKYISKYIRKYISKCMGIIGLIRVNNKG